MRETVGRTRTFTAQVLPTRSRWPLQVSGCVVGIQTVMRWTLQECRFAGLQ